MHTVLFLQNIGIGEIVIIALVILLLFGGKKIPELMKGLGKGVKSFKQGMSEVEEEINKVDEDIRKSVSDEPKKKDSEEK